MTRDLKKLEAWVDRRLWKGVSATERKILIAYKEALDDIRKALGKVYEKYAQNGVLTHAEMTKYHRLKSLHDQLTGTMGPVLSKNGRLVEKLAEVQYEESYYLHAWALDQHAGMQFNWGLLNEKAVKAAVTNSKWRAYLDIAIKDLKLKSLSDLDRAITQGLIRGFSYENMAKELKKVLGVSAKKARLIAQNEAARAQIIGKLETHRQADDMGIISKAIWDATLDRRTRPEHAALDQQEATMRELASGTEVPMWYVHFPDGGADWVEGPKLSGNASFDINCRCTVTQQIEGYEPTSRWAREDPEKSGKIIPMTKFGDWAKDHGIAKNIYGQEYR